MRHPGGRPRKLLSNELLKPALYVRMTPDMVEALDEYVARVRASRPGVTFSRSDVVREILLKAIGWPGTR